MTRVPCVYFAEQTRPQSIPAPLTLPEPPRPIESVNCGANEAVTFSASFTLTVHVSCVPLHAPPQPVKTEPDAGLAVRVTEAFRSYDAEHLLPQLMNLSAEFTLPLPDFATVSEGTPTLAAVICAPTKSPSSPSCGALHSPSAHSASCVEKKSCARVRVGATVRARQRARGMLRSRTPPGSVPPAQTISPRPNRFAEASR